MNPESSTHKQSKVADIVSKIVLWSVAAAVSVVFVWILYTIFINGYSQLSWDFLTSPPLDAGRQGGISSILISTLLILSIAMFASIPLGLGTAVYLAEFTSPDSSVGKLVRRSLDTLAGIPSIVFGLFGYAFFSKLLGFGFSILSGGLTLACMVLPLFIRTAEEGLRALPNSYRLGAYSLGLSHTTTIMHILLPQALPALLAGFILAIGRAIAETAALLFTSGYVDRMPSSLFDSGRALSVHIYDLSMNVPGGNSQAYASALVLITLILVINITAIYISNNYFGRGLRAK